MSFVPNMLPNPFEKPLPKLEDTDPDKNRAITQAFLGNARAKRFEELFSGEKAAVETPTTKEALLSEADYIIEQQNKLKAEAFFLNSETARHSKQEKRPLTI